MFEVIKTEGNARRGVFTCPHGTVQTPVFMNVWAPRGDQRGGVRPRPEGDRLSGGAVHTYHLHLRPGDGVVGRWAGCTAYAVGRSDAHRAAAAFRCFPCPGCGRSPRRGDLRLPHRRTAHLHGAGGVHADPVNLGSDIAMAFDECTSKTLAPGEYVQTPVERNTRWLERCVASTRASTPSRTARQPRPDALRHQPGGTYAEHPAAARGAHRPPWTATASPSAVWR